MYRLGPSALSARDSDSAHAEQGRFNACQLHQEQQEGCSSYMGASDDRDIPSSDLFLHFLGREFARSESSIGSDARREMIIKATTNIYDTNHITWPENILAKLTLANEIMSLSSCPCLFRGLRYASLGSGSLLASLARSWGFSPASIALGSTYFQRLIALQENGTIGQWVLASISFKPYQTIAKGSVKQSRSPRGLDLDVQEKGVRAFDCPRS